MEGYGKTTSIKYVPNITSHIHRDLAAGKVIVGTMFRDLDNLNDLISPIRTAADLGYRFIVFDCEHMAFNIQILAKFAKEAHETGISFWIRPEQSEHAFISRYADIGASGFMVPNVIGTSRAHNVVNQAYYGPIADKKADITRGYSLGQVVLDGQKFNTMRGQLDYANNNMFVAVQTEHPRGIENLEAILSVKGVNGTIIGPNDLARNIAAIEGQSLIELPFNEMYRHELMINAYKKIGEIAKIAGKFAGAHFSGIKQMDLVEMLVHERGYKLIMLGTDSNFTEEEILATKEKIEKVR